MTADSTLFIVDNGKLTACDAASAYVPGTFDGLAVFEDVRCYRNARTDALFVFRLDEHVKRFMRSMRLAAMNAPCTAKKLTGAVISAIKQSELGECCVRMSAYRPASSCVEGNPLAQVAISCERVGAAGVDGAGECAAGAVVSSWRSIPVDSLPSAMRCIAGSSVAALAKQEAAAFGANEAIMLNGAGFVCQSTCGNVIVVRDGVLSTPPASSGAYESVMRDTALNLAMDLDVPAIEEQLTRADLYIADEAFLADDAFGIVPLVRIDGSQVGKGKPGVITEAIRKRFAKAATGGLDDYSGWLTNVE